LALKELKVGEVADEPRESIYLLDSLQISQINCFGGENIILISFKLVSISLRCFQINLTYRKRKARLLYICL